MSNPVDVEVLLEGGLEEQIRFQPSRQRLAKQLPDRTAEYRRNRTDQETLQEWARQLHEYFPALHRRRGDRWDEGWSELLGALALSIELLDPSRVESLEDELEGTPAQKYWRCELLSYERYALVVDGSGGTKRRVFAAPGDYDYAKRIEGEAGIDWGYDGTLWTGRSHTLLLGLMADGALTSNSTPIAASGELVPGPKRQVVPVDCLVEKARAWWDAFPERGHLISAPLGEGDKDDGSRWAELLDIASGKWTVGASIGEILAKLHSNDVEIPGWDGRPLALDELTELKFSNCGDELPQKPLRDPLYDAAWAAYRGASPEGSGQRGVLIEGGPGSGKSILSSVLEHRFNDGRLSALGYGVRRDAGQLVEAIEETGDDDWASVLAFGEPENRALFKVLGEQRRLVPIVDGLDEITSRERSTISTWLRSDSGWWIATGRPTHHGSAKLPRKWKLEIDDFGARRARVFLEKYGRSDLAQWLRERSRLAEASPVSELTKTPLHLALLAEVVESGERPDEMSLDDLYQQVFHASLGRAHQSDRLTEDDVRRLKYFQSELIGELALNWLCSSEQVIDLEMLNDAFSELEVSNHYSERDKLLRALEFGQLLVPAGQNCWTFGHRTLAEWAAAKAIRRRVKEKLSDNPDRREIARIELQTLEPFLEQKRLPQHGQWATIRRFYAASALEPLALLDAFIGPARVERVETVPSKGPEASVTQISRRDIAEAWPWAFRWLGDCHWTCGKDARMAWAIGVRLWLFVSSDPGGHEDDMPSSLESFAESIGDYLPETMDGLIELAANTSDQQKELKEDPLVLLPAIPAVRAQILQHYLTSGQRRQQRSVLQWYRRRNVEPPVEPLEQLSARLPGELEGLPERGSAESYCRNDDGDDRCRVLEELESVVWDALIDSNDGPEKSVIRKRFEAWPSHLESELKRWFGALERPLDTGARGQEAVKLRRDTLAAVIQHLADPDNQGSDRETDHRPPEIRRWQRRAEMLAGVLNASVVDDVVGALWELLPKGGDARVEILRVLPEMSRVPSQISAEDVLRRPDLWRKDSPRFNWTESHLDSPRLNWTESHLEELKRLSENGRGRLRFDALRQQMGTDGRVESPVLLSALKHNGNDRKFEEAVCEEINKRGRSKGASSLAKPEPSSFEKFSIALRAHWDIAGWKDELLERIEKGDDGDLRKLLRLAVTHRVQRALPLLCQMVGENGRNDDFLVEAAALLADPDDDSDHENMRGVVRFALRNRWPDSRYFNVGEEAPQNPGVALGEFLRVEELEVLAKGPVSGLQSTPLADAVARLGDAGLQQLLKMYRRRYDAQDVDTADSSQDDASRRALAEIILASIDGNQFRPSKLVELLEELGQGDVHKTYSTPGTLGDAFDEPGDQNWGSDQLNASFIDEARQALEASLESYPEDWKALRKLFKHSSASLRVLAFELCADRADKPEIASLALEALEGHFNFDDTRRVGQTDGYALALHQPGTGQMGAEIRRVDSELIEEVFARLTPAHRDVVKELSDHETPVFRFLAACWAGELGNSKWTTFIAPLLEDANPAIVHVAADTIGHLSPGELEKYLKAAERDEWTSEHYYWVLKALTGIREVSRETLARLLLEAAEQLAEHDENNEARDDKSCFDGYPSVVEEVWEARELSSSGRLTSLSSDWTSHGDHRVRAVAHRLLARGGVLEPEVLEALLFSEESAERINGAECAVRLGAGDYRERSRRILEASIQQFFSEKEFRVLGLDAPEHSNPGASLRPEELPGIKEIRQRVMWALQKAPLEFAQSIEFAISRLDPGIYGGYLSCDQRLLEQALELLREWGTTGALTLLELMDERRIVEDANFVTIVAESAKEFPEVRAAVEAGASEELPASTRILKMVRDDKYRYDLSGLCDDLVRDVFPEQWPV